MKRIMVRLEDDLHTRINNAAHDARTSMNAYVIGVLAEATEPNAGDQ